MLETSRRTCDKVEKAPNKAIYAFTSLLVNFATPPSTTTS